MFGLNEVTQMLFKLYFFASTSVDHSAIQAGNKTSFPDWKSVACFYGRGSGIFLMYA